jgi:hypothetical protein
VGATCAPAFMRKRGGARPVNQIWEIPEWIKKGGNPEAAILSGFSSRLGETASLKSLELEVKLDRWTCQSIF